jgi:hypothetical protein
MEVAARDVLPEIADRVFDKGKATDGSLIGEYSTKPIYIEQSKSPRAAGERKAKTYFFKGGYREFKSKIGRGTKVNLKVFGRLQMDFLTPKKVNIANGVKYELKNDENVKKKVGAEDHFKKDIFNLTKEERITIVNTFAFEITRTLT